ncbi:hypothetical protein EF912_28030 [Streptomyces sp. WAC07061]|uniref:hypothetical protein n=1 Tax=Streptomyces sp. WAC07061 TaxID=2487410 RepID=UPI000F7AB0AF|nr:hypothetical protein [Streptomyces sp. WAC07061]RSS45833.1 hypothetical protein EF912_28030 [Streptomyces sp. WAC07061]
MPWINAYVKSDGTKVSSYFRLPPGARRETALLGLIVAGVFIFGNGTTTAGAGAGAGTDAGQGSPQIQNQNQTQTQPVPASTPVYPIRWPAWENLPAPRPEPTVSYPIVFPSPVSGR